MKICLLCKSQMGPSESAYNDMGFCCLCAEHVANEFTKKHFGFWLTYENPPQERKQGLRKKLKASVRTAVMERCEYACVSCGIRKKLVIDHIIPLSAGGTDEEQNLQVLCWTCNSRKQDLSPEEWQKKSKGVS